MTPTTERKVRAMKVVGEVYKSRDMRGNCFAVDVEYTLEDDSTYKSRVTSGTKKRLPERIESKQRFVDNGAITVDSNGWEVCRFSIF